MGNKGSLSKEDIKQCTNVATDLSKYVSEHDVKRLLAQWRKDFKGKDEISEPAQLLLLLNHVEFFKKQEKALRTAIMAQTSDPEVRALALDVVSKLVNEDHYQLVTSEQMFAAFDKDKNHKVSFTEFASGFAVYSSGDAKEKATVLFNAWDEDGNGSISKEEARKTWFKSYEGGFRAGVALGFSFASQILKQQLKTVVPPGKLNKLVEKFKDMFMSFCEEGLREVKAHQDEIVDKLFELADKNSDNVLSLDEFVAYSTDPAISGKVNELAKKINETRMNQVRQGVLEKLVEEILNSKE